MHNGKISLRPVQKAIDLFHSILDWIYPTHCRICDGEADLNPFICSHCFAELKKFDASPDSITYHKDHPAEEVKALYYFDNSLQQLVHDIKYRDASYIAHFLGQALGQYYQGQEISHCDALVPVPLYSVRKRERTYNQSACLAKGISKKWRVPVLSKGIKRARNTNTQTKLNKNERRENIAGAFKVKPGMILPERLCIVDDVFTTGATTMELARVLKTAGAKHISILCLATPYHDKQKTQDKETESK